MRFSLSATQTYGYYYGIPQHASKTFLGFSLSPFPFYVIMEVFALLFMSAATTTTFSINVQAQAPSHENKVEVQSDFSRLSFDGMNN